MESFLKKHLNNNHCFLCGTSLTSKTRSDEHIIPAWLQKEHNLRDSRLTLLNHTSIPYRKLVIPCCTTCNNEPLSTMEKDVSRLLSGTFRKPTPHEEFRLFQWCSKILYGLLHREMMLLADQRNNLAGSIVRKSFLENLTTFHHFMTSIRRPFSFVDFVPYSLFTVETLTFDDPKRNFDYLDFIVIGPKGGLTAVLVLAIRVQNFGVICIHNDNGYQKAHFQEEFDRYLGIPLHPIQFLELACKAAYKHSLLSFIPQYFSVADEPINSEVRVFQTSFPKGEIWNKWVNNDYAHLFCSTASNSGFIVPEPDQFYDGVMQHTWLDDGHGNPVRITTNDEKTVLKGG